MDYSFEEITSWSFFFLPSEPGVASSDATNMEATILPDGDSYIVNGRKWWSTGLYVCVCDLVSYDKSKISRLTKTSFIIFHSQFSSFIWQL